MPAPISPQVVPAVQFMDIPLSEIVVFDFQYSVA